MWFLYIKSVGGVICVSIMGIRLRCPVNLRFIRFTGHQENGLKKTYNKINCKQAKMFCKEERSKENS